MSGAGMGVAKRVFDVVGAGAGLVLLSPVLGVVAVVSLLALGRPILFRQVRAGYQGRPFRIVKFRTMKVAESCGDVPLTDSQRLTRWGSLLRELSLDELPELWNVLRGDMSLVGPRPLLMEYLPLYSAEQRRRHDVRPGITGWAQVNGRNATEWGERFRLDTWYVDHVSLALDLKIVALTVRRVIAREGISAPAHATMPRFTGSAR